MLPGGTIDRRGLGRVRREIEKWREKKSTRAMPERLWTFAVALARRHGVYRVSRELRLNSGTLRERMGQGDTGESVAQGTLCASKNKKPFVELDWPMKALPVERGLESGVQVQLDSVTGEKMKIQLPAGTAVEWDALFGAWHRAGQGGVAAPCARQEILP